MNKKELHRGSVSSTPQLLSLESSPRRNSTGKITPKDSVSKSQIDGKILPNYLRASTSSCHDFCKYGKEHTFEAKERRPTFPKALGNVANPGNREDTINSSNFGNGRKLSMNKGTVSGSTSGRAKAIDKKVVAPLKEVKPAELAKTMEKKPPMKDILSSDGASDELHVCSIDNIQEPDLTTHVSPSFENTTSCDDLDIINPDLSSISFEVDDDVHEEKKLEQCSSVNDHFDQPEVIKVEIAVAKKIGSSKELESVKPNIGMENLSPANKPPRKMLASGKSNTAKGKLAPAIKPLASTKIRLNRQTVVHGRKGLGSDSAKAAGLLIQRAEHAVPALKPSSSAKGNSGKITAAKKGVVNVRSPLVKREKQVLPAQASIPLKVQPHRSSSDLKSKSSPDARGSSLRGMRRSVVKTDMGGSSLRDQRSAVVEIAGEKVEEKTIYVIEPKENSEASSGTQPNATASQSGTSTADQVILSTSQSSTSNKEVPEREGSEYHPAVDNDSLSEEDDDAIELLNTKGEKKIGRGGMEHSQERDPAAAKLNFRRGKVVNLQSENNTPRKLRFRRGTVLGNSPDVKGKADKRSFGRKEQSADDSSKAGYKPPKVVLRHQGAQQKKETKGLFNHVIEETASKLVETRKSKVKALVGAFETVISLQESKPVSAM